MATRLRNVLTDKRIRAAKPTDSPTVWRTGRPFLYISPTGAKSWQYRYRHDDKPQTASHGRFSDQQGLAWARSAAETAGNKASTGEHLTRVKAVKESHQ